MFRLKPLLTAVLGLALGVAVAHAEPPSPDSTPPGASASSARSDGQNITERSLNAVSEAASKIGDVISSGALALGLGVQHATGQASALLGNARDALGIRYRWGGTTAQTGFDCSGFVRAVVQQTVGRLLPHRAADQAAVTQAIRKDELQPGDLVFFNTVRRRAYSHVGIYMGDGQFIHAPSRGKSVRIDSLSQAYWQQRFEGARRVLTGETASDYSLTSADEPDLGASRVAAPSASLSDAAASTAHDDLAANATPAALAGNLKVADAGLPGSPAEAAAPRPDSARQPAARSSASHVAARHGRAQKQGAVRSDGRYKQAAATNSKKPSHRAAARRGA
jgi:cell wall-associated NlpC family hydrolase